MRKITEILVRRVRTTITSEKPCEGSADANPDTTIFDRAKMDFSLGVSGSSGCDLHNAYRQGYIQIGTLLHVSRRIDFEDGQSSKILAFVGPAEPFINPENGRPRHLFFDSRYANGQSLIVIDDLTDWEYVLGKLTTDENKRLGRILLNRGNEASKRKEVKNNKKMPQTIIPH